MKTNLLLIIVHSVLVQCAVPLHSVNSALDTILVLDCQGTLHLAPNSFIASSFKSPLAALVKSAMTEVESRVKDCWCANKMNQSEFDMFYDPVMATLNAAQPGKQDSPACTSDAHFVRDVVKGLQAGLGDEFTVNLPDSCTLDSYQNGAGCFIQANIKDFNATLQMALARCDRMYDVRHPYMSLTCDGPGCRAFSPCNVDSDCGGAIKCYQPSTSDLLTQMPEYFFRFLKNAWYYDSDVTINTAKLSPSSIMNHMWNYATTNGYWPGGVATTEFGVCLPRALARESIDWNTILDDIVTVTTNNGQCAENVVVTLNHRADNQWNGILQNGESAASHDRMTGAAFGSQPPMYDADEGLSLFGWDCDGNMNVMGSERWGISAKFPTINGLAAEFVKQLTDLYYNKKNVEHTKFEENMAWWSPAMWLGGLLQGSTDANTAYPANAETVAKNMLTSPQSTPKLYPMIWTNQYPATQSTSRTSSKSSSDVEAQHRTLFEAVKSTASQHLSKLLGPHKAFLDEVTTKLGIQQGEGPPISPNVASDYLDIQGGSRIQEPPGTTATGGKSTCTFNGWTNNGKASLAIPGINPMAGTSNAKAGVARCKQYPNGLPIMAATCQDSWCSYIHTKGAVCSHDSDCTPFGQDFGCVNVFHTQDLNTQDFIGEILWKPRSACQQPNPTGNCDCRPIAAGIGTVQWDICYNNEPGCVITPKCFGPTFIDKFLNNVWGDLTGYKATGGNLTVCMNKKLMDHNVAYQDLFRFNVSIVAGKYGVPPHQEVFWDRLQPVTTNFNNITQLYNQIAAWYKNNPVAPFPADYMEQASSKQAPETTLQHVLTQELRNTAKAKLGKPVNPASLSSVYINNWNGPFQVELVIQRSSGSDAQQAGLFDSGYDKILKPYLENVVGMKNLKAVPASPPSTCSSWDNQPVYCLNQPWCDYANQKCVETGSTKWLNVSGVYYNTHWYWCSDVWSRGNPDQTIGDYGLQPNIDSVECGPNTNLPNDDVEVWFKVQIRKDMYTNTQLQTVYADWNQLFSQQWKLNKLTLQPWAEPNKVFTVDGLQSGIESFPKPIGPAPPPPPGPGGNPTPPGPGNPTPPSTPSPGHFDDNGSMRVSWCAFVALTSALIAVVW